MDIKEMTELIKSLRKDTTTSGLLTTSDLNFYYLEPQAKTIYPVFYPLLASIPRYQPTYNGVVVGGPGVNWKAIVAIDTGGYPMVSEKNRNEFMNYKTRDYFAAYKYLGKESFVTFQAEQTGLGFDDMLGLQQVSELNALLNDEEREILWGNSGSTGNGFQLGQTATPSIALATGGSITTGTNLSVRCIALTGWGYWYTTATGVALPRVRGNADGSQDIINGGTAAISNSSAVVATTGATLSITASVVPVAGSVAYAWYIDSTDASAPTLANAVFYGMTSVPTVTIGVLPAGTNQKGNASNAVGNLTTDNSSNLLDFDGLTTWTFSNSTATQPSYWKDLGGANLTANGDGTIAEFETVFDFLWSNYKLTPDIIYVGGTLMDAVSKKILGAGVANTSTRLVFETNQAGQLTGGSFTVAYRSKYGAQGGTLKTLKVMTHPWLPQGVIYFDLVNNPYPAAGNTIPAVRRIATLQDHFSIKWPYRNLSHEFGIYAFESLLHYIPFGSAILTGVGPS
jgi:hypothetical protein